ncbi:hypothetical protein HYU18_03825 [Candidatus Woesearchaeota archaeon]|nr:hypothetical protein [Candidatus Woesearchaeota archaeon]
MAQKKGGVESSLLVKMITVLTLGIILFVLVKGFGNTGINLAEKSTCKESVRQYALYNKIGVAGFSLADTDAINCPVRQVSINPSDSEKAKGQLAEAMFNCLDQWGGHDYNLFDTNRMSSDHYCVVCSKVTFTDKTKPIDGFAGYLIKNGPPGYKGSYYEYFKGEPVTEAELNTITSIKTGEKFEGALKSAPLPIDTSADHVILFTYSKSTGWWDNIVAGEVGGTVGIVVGGAVAGFFTGGVGWVVAGAAVLGTAGAGYGFATAPNLQDTSEWQAGVMLLPYNKNVADYLKCDEVPIK